MSIGVRPPASNRGPILGRLPFPPLYPHVGCAILQNLTRTTDLIVNNTICLDSGCVFGGALTALHYPEREIVSVPAQREYFHPLRPLKKAPATRLPDARDLLARQRIETGLDVTVIRDEERSLAALETMGRFAVNPDWLIYLPPTMSSCETSPLPDYLEHPLEAFG